MLYEFTRDGNGSRLEPPEVSEGRRRFRRYSDERKAAMREQYGDKEIRFQALVDGIERLNYPWLKLPSA